MGRRKLDAKQFALQKRKRRQWLTFLRMISYGVHNFTRNAWLTIAATAVMTITLLIVFSTLAARSTLLTTVDDIRDKVDMSIYLKNEVSDEAVAQIQSDLKKLDTVVSVSYTSPEQAREDFARNNSGNELSLSAINQATNRFPGRLRVKVKDINDTKELAAFVKDNENVKENLDPNRPPSFEGPRKMAIRGIAEGVVFAERAGMIATIIFVVISSLIVFNTIRMAIFNRRDEIEMMKLIGADRSFIRGPFIVEAVVYGFIAAIIATGLGIAGLLFLKGKLIEGIELQPTIDFVLTYVGLVLLGMMAVGAVIGIISSLLATRRYLKI